MNQKTKKAKSLPPTVTTGIDPDHYFEFTDRPAKVETFKHLVGSNHKKASPRKSAQKKQLTTADYDRIRLRDIEVFLNNCLNLAQGIETKRMTKVIQLLRDARTQAQKLRG